MGKMQIEISNTEFTDKVSITLHFPETELLQVEKKLNEILCNSKKYFPESITMGPKR